MASWTTPRTANVADLWTAAWYNAEVKNDEIWIHDTILSQGASFPASPLTGQRHLFVSGNVRELFVYDGAHWLSEVTTRLQLVRGVVSGSGESLTYNPSSGAEADFALYEPSLNVNEYLAAGMTLQGRLDSVTNADLSKVPLLGLAVTSFVTSGFATGRTRIAGTAVTGIGWQAGAWADLLTGSYQGARLGLYGSWTAAGGSPTIQVYQAVAELRFKK